MNIRAPKFCMKAGCGTLVRSGYCEAHKPNEAAKRKAGQRDYNRRRAMSDKLYGQQKWRKLSIAFRKRNPLCENCEKKGLARPADLVDHIEPAKLRPDLFFSWRNLRSLCQTCHNKIGEKVLS